ncbi:hypothetical protein J437_LFUL007147 [Ladona fulva]|uniref:Glucosylceramidase n=1 Tax=Ladona fulva TaxID=123851 RepID=A0A8K0P365_LADFU|nr:hypothetical protein J437_LFUL007147 [Ladona fulva]
MAHEGEGAVPCVPRDFGNGGTVCVCNSSYCDTVDPISPSSPGNYVLYTSSKDGLRFKRSNGVLRPDYENVTGDIQMVVEADLKYQRIIGFGGAFTDAAGINIESLSPAAQELLMQSYFSQLGTEYNIGRVPIAGCDFSTRTYTYDDIPGDILLSHFNLTQEDFLFKIPLIRRAIDLSNGSLILIGSAWTAPPWMKTNNDYSGFGFLKREFFQLWAEYHIKFLDAYKDLGLELWALTTGNEPINGIIPINRFNSMGWTPKEMREWIAENIGPTIATSKHKQTKLIMLDDQRFLLPWWVNLVLRDPRANKFVDGIGVHWYWDSLFPRVKGLTMKDPKTPCTLVGGNNTQ